MNSTTSQLEQADILKYLTENPGKPVYVVEGTSILLSLIYLGKNKVQSEVYIPGTDNSITDQVDIALLKTSKYWKPTYQFYTSFGMKVLLDTWEAKPA